MVRTTTTKPKDGVKKVSVKPLQPLQRLTSVGGDEDVVVGIKSGLKGAEFKGGSIKSNKSEKETIHDILNKMAVPSNNPDAKAGKLAAERWRSAKDIYEEFCTETSFTALTRIHKAKHMYKRIAWLVICLAMVTWMTIQIVWLFQKYLSWPIEVKIEVTAVSKLDFPSVTICNLNPLRRSQQHMGPFAALSDVFEIKDTDTLYDDFMSDLEDKWEELNDTSYDIADMSFLSSFMEREDYNKWSALENDSTTAEKFYSEMDSGHIAQFQYSSVAVNIRNDARFKQYGHQLDNFLLACTWQGKACSPTNFTYVRNNKYGNCYTINAHDNGQTKLTTDYAGPLMGMTLELNIEQDEYMPSLSQDAGVRVMIHPRGTYPFPEDDGMSIAPGFKTSIAIEQQELLRLPPPHADCGNTGVNINDMYEEKFSTKYTKQTCLRSCYQSTFQTTCGCASSFYYVPDNSSVCDMTDANFTLCMQTKVCSVISECSVKCPAPCEETKYDFTTSMSKWPSEQYADHLSAKIQKTNSDFRNKDRLDSSEDTLCKLEIYFKDLIYEKIEQQKAYESQNLISDIGGQLGLWLGLSAITVGELVEFIASISRLATAKCFKKRAPGDIDTPLTRVSPMVP